MPVILITGVCEKMHPVYGSEPDNARLSAKAFLEKPVPPGRLLEEIRRQFG